MPDTPGSLHHATEIIKLYYGNINHIRCDRSIDPGTVFYAVTPQAIRELISESEDAFLLSFLADTNHITQELMDRGCDPKKIFTSVLAYGETMNATMEEHFYADILIFLVNVHTTLFCFKVTCDGNIFLI